MKLRFRSNSLRLRVNRNEVQQLAAGETLTESLAFPGGTALTYQLRSGKGTSASASYESQRIDISLPHDLLSSWAKSEDIGLYFDLPTDHRPLKIAIEKDLVCIDGPEEERDPDAYPRSLAESTAC